MKISVICGTNRDGALTRMLSKIVAKSYSDLDEVEVDLIDMNELSPAFLEPKAYKEPNNEISDLINRFIETDGSVFIIPEYNGSFPGVLKLFVDMLPYPAGFDKRPCAYIGLAAGQFKGLRAVEHFQQVSGYRNAYQYPRRLFIGDSYKQFDFEKQALVDEELQTRVTEQASGFVEFVSGLKK